MKARIAAVVVAAVVVGALAMAAAVADPPGASEGPAQPMAAGHTWTKLESRDGKAIAGTVPATFCVFFRPGEIPKGQAVAVSSGGRELPAQVDVKRTFDDGSIKYALVSVVLPGLDAAGLTLSYSAKPAEGPKPMDSAALIKKLLDTDFDSTVTLTFPDGRAVTASARKMLEADGGKGRTWLAGPTAIEWLLMGPPTGADGKADPDMAVQFQVRYYPATGHTRVSAVVEKCSDQGSDGGIIYDVVMQRGKAKPQTVFEEKGVHHADLMRWRKVFWVGAEPAEINPRMDAESMVAAAVIPPYDLSLKVPEAAIARVYAQWQKVAKGIGQNGLYRAYMPATGGGDDRGLLPRWDAMYLLTMDPRMREAVIGADELAGSAGMHARSSKADRIVTQDARPNLWLGDSRCKDPWRPKPAPPRTDDKVKSVFECDLAHVPAMGYGAYLATGDYFFLEETYFWGAYSVLWSNPSYREKVVWCGQLRGMAWGLRLALDAAMVAPDGEAEKEYFTRMVTDTVQYHFRWVSPDPANPMKARFPESPIEGTASVSICPFQHDLLVLVADWAARAGIKDAGKLTAGLLPFSMGRFTSPDFNPYCGGGYWWMYSENGKTYDTWKALYERNYGDFPKDRMLTAADAKKLPFSNAEGVWVDNVDCYPCIARAAAAVGVRTGFPKAKEVYDFISKNSPNLLKVENATPTWAFNAAPER